MINELKSMIVKLSETCNKTLINLFKKLYNFIIIGFKTPGTKLDDFFFKFDSKRIFENELAHKL